MSKTESPNLHRVRMLRANLARVQAFEKNTAAILKEYGGTFFQEKSRIEYLVKELTETTKKVVDALKMIEKSKKDFLLIGEAKVDGKKVGLYRRVGRS